MAIAKRLYLVSFDISLNKVRYRAVKVLLKYGIRVQKSVFECLLNDKQYLDMKYDLDALIVPETDSIRYYLLCKNCARVIEISGKGSWTLDEDVIVV